MLEEINKRLQDHGIEIDQDDLDQLIDRFGEPEEKHLDEFIKLILNLAEVQPVQLNKLPQTVEVGKLREDAPRLSEYFEEMHRKIEDRVKEESDRLLTHYKGIPREIQSSVTQGLIEHQASVTKDKSLANYKAVADMSTVFALNQLESRRFLRTMFSVLSWFCLCLIVLGFLADLKEEKNERYRNPNDTAEVNQSQNQR